MPQTIAVMLAGLLLCGVGTATAVDDELLPGRKLSLRQGKKGARLAVIARAGLAAPLPGGSDDPTRIGARVDIGNPLTNEWARLEAPAAGWSVNTTGTAFRFESTPRARPRPLRAVIRHGKGLRIAGSAVGITLDEEAQRTLAVIVTTGTRRYCMVFGGKVRHDGPGRFVARAAPAPAGCPTPSSVPTPTTSTTSSTRPRPGRSTTTSTTSSSTTTALPPGVPTTSSSTSSTPVTVPSPSSSSSTSSTEPPTTSSTAVPAPTTSTTQPPAGGADCEGLDVPTGHRPPSGLCRIWFPERPPGQQPPAGPCDALAGAVPNGACLLRG